jgi:hypothetical protein
MEIKEISITGTEFEFNGVKYDAKFAIRKDKKLIIAEANESHKEEFEKLYDKDSLKPNYVRLFLDEKNEIVYAMIIYLIKYKEESKYFTGRSACGNYYPIYKAATGKNFLEPHPYQASICW